MDDGTPSTFRLSFWDLFAIIDPLPLADTKYLSSGKEFQFRRRTKAQEGDLATRSYNHQSRAADLCHPFVIQSEIQSDTDRPRRMYRKKDTSAYHLLMSQLYELQLGVQHKVLVKISSIPWIASKDNLCVAKKQLDAQQQSISVI